jgi:CFEM domain
MNVRCRTRLANTVDFSVLPLCSRTCVRNNIIRAYCNTTITRNCFCRFQVKFERFSPCVQNGCGVAADEAVNITTKFFNDTCICPPSIDGSSTSSSSSCQQVGDEVINAPSSTVGGQKSEQLGYFTPKHIMFSLGP